MRAGFFDITFGIRRERRARPTTGTVLLPVQSFYQPTDDDGKERAGQKLNDYAEYPEIQLIEKSFVDRVIGVYVIQYLRGAVLTNGLRFYLTGE